MYLPIRAGLLMSKQKLKQEFLPFFGGTETQVAVTLA